MFNKDEKGQSVIIIAVSIVLVLAVAFGAYNVQSILVAKQKVRQMTDATALAGALSRKVGLDAYQQLANLDILLAVSWELGAAWENILDGANYVHDVVPGYDPTADLFATDNTIPNIVPIKNHISFVHKKGLVEDTTYAKAQQYLILEALLYAKAVEAKNLEIPTFPHLNQMSLLIPSEMIISRGPVLSYTEVNYAPYDWEVARKDGRMIFLIQKPDPDTGEMFATTIGLMHLELVDSPQPLFSAFLSAFTSGKSGKLSALAYAYPYNMEEITGEVLEPVDPFVNDMEAINAENTNRVKDIRQISQKPNPTAQDISDLKALWNTLVADYNYLLEFCEQIGLLDVLDISSGAYRSNPVMGSLHNLNLLGLKGYRDIADNKGIDYTTEEGKDDFYKTLTFQDIFGSKETFWQDLRTTYQTLIDNNTTYSDDLSDLLNTCKFYDIDSSGGNNVPALLKTIPDLVYANLEHSTLDPFLTLSNMISEDIVNCYSNLVALPSSTANNSLITVDSLMPSTTMMNYLDSIFTAPIIRWEGS